MPLELPKHTLSDASLERLQKTFHEIIARYGENGTLLELENDGLFNQYGLEISPYALEERDLPPIFRVKDGGIIIRDIGIRAELYEAVQNELCLPENEAFADAMCDLCDASGKPALLLQGLPTTPDMRDMMVMAISLAYSNQMLGADHVITHPYSGEDLAEHEEQPIHIDGNGHNASTIRMLGIDCNGKQNPLPTAFFSLEEVVDSCTDIMAERLELEPKTDLKPLILEALQAPLWHVHGDDPDDALHPVLIENTAAFRKDGSLRADAMRYHCHTNSFFRPPEAHQMDQADYLAKDVWKTLAQKQPRFAAMDDETRFHFVDTLSLCWEKAINTALKAEPRGHCLAEGELAIWNNRAIVHGPTHFTHAQSADTALTRTVIGGSSPTFSADPEQRGCVPSGIIFSPEEHAAFLELAQENVIARGGK